MGMEGELKYEDVVGLTFDDVVKHYFPDASPEERDVILWSETCFPMDTEIALKQLYELSLKLSPPSAQ